MLTRWRKSLRNLIVILRVVTKIRLLFFWRLLGRWYWKLIFFWWKLANYLHSGLLCGLSFDNGECRHQWRRTVGCWSRTCCASCCCCWSVPENLGKSQLAESTYLETKVYFYIFVVLSMQVFFVRCRGRRSLGMVLNTLILRFGAGNETDKHDTWNGLMDGRHETVTSHNARGCAILATRVLFSFCHTLHVVSFFLNVHGKSRCN